MLNDTNDKRVKAAWENSLGHQIPGGANPTYEEVKEYLTSLLDIIFNKQGLLKKSEMNQILDAVNEDV